jgi:hypothetical protein
VAGFNRMTTLAKNGHFSNELCAGSTCVTPAQFQAMVAAANEAPTTSTNQSGAAAQLSPAATPQTPASVSQTSISNSSSTSPICVSSATAPVIQINDNSPPLTATGTAQ